MSSRTLSKTRFRLAIECPTKVHYSLDRNYANRMQDDEFLAALADGGHQVGALAKLMFRGEDPGAVEVVSTDQDAQVRETARLLERENVTIFEGTIRHHNLLVRADVLVKRGNHVDLIEVKAKSWNPECDSLTGRTPRANPIDPDWEPYVYDVAFQEWVLNLAYPTFEIRPWLMLVDKTATNSVADLGHQFPIVGDGRSRIVETVNGFDVNRLANALLIKVDASEAVGVAQTQVRRRRGKSDIEFNTLINKVSVAISRGERLGPEVGSACKSCEFYCPPAERSNNVRSGWAECMEAYFGKSVSASREESIFGLYNRANIAGHLKKRRLWIRDLEEADLEVSEERDKVSMTFRHGLQWREIRDQDNEPFLRKEALRKAMCGWTFPLHFIDFETARPALPFHAGQRPYQQILFQFSHHVVTSEGQVGHADQCLITDGNGSPSIAVVRQLREDLGNDSGTVLHWYPHERSVLNDIRTEICAANPPDAAGLLTFLDSLGLEKDAKGRLFDLGRLVADQAFLAGTGGSSSMKKFLPAVLRHSAMIREKYASPVYGTKDMPSHNFQSQTWVVERDDFPVDPYKLLDPLFNERVLDDALAQLESERGEVVANGAKAMIAYAKLQNPASSADQKESLRIQLLRYCELDTLAMVMVYEALRDWVRA